MILNIIIAVVALVWVDYADILYSGMFLPGNIMK